MEKTGIERVRAELRAQANPEKARALQRFFKTGPGEYGEGDVFLGTGMPAVRRLAARHKDLSAKDVQRLLASPYHEERMIALRILVRQYDREDDAARDRIFRLYMKNRRRINNWDLVDVTARHIVGRHLMNRSRGALRRLARSPSLWDRRIAVMSSFWFVRYGDFADTLALAGMLLDDPEDLIHKAVGWMRREVGKRNPAAAEGFLRLHYRRMPRTMLRYAIEKLPVEKRRRYLQGQI